MSQVEHSKHRNAFDFLRLLSAFLVIVSHATALFDGNRQREVLTRLFGTISFGDLAAGSTNASEASVFDPFRTSDFDPKQTSASSRHSTSRAVAQGCPLGDWARRLPREECSTDEAHPDLAS